jgi:hypothetical protein
MVAGCGGSSPRAAAEDDRAVAPSTSVVAVTNHCPPEVRTFPVVGETAGGVLWRVSAHELGGARWRMELELDDSYQLGVEFFPASLREYAADGEPTVPAQFAAVDMGAGRFVWVGVVVPGERVTTVDERGQTIDLQPLARLPDIDLDLVVEEFGFGMSEASTPRHAEESRCME